MNSSSMMTAAMLPTLLLVSFCSLAAALVLQSEPAALTHSLPDPLPWIRFLSEVSGPASPESELPSQVSGCSQMCHQQSGIRCTDIYHLLNCSAIAIACHQCSGCCQESVAGAPPPLLPLPPLPPLPPLNPGQELRCPPATRDGSYTHTGQLG
eukprot:2835835-Pleurochrysis_carterae.AAC.1